MLCRNCFVQSIKLFCVSYSSRSSSYLRFLTRQYSKQTSKSPYEVLGLKNTCSTKDVKKAYIKLCKELHPDIKPNDNSQHKKFVELNDAYTTLVNESSRKQWDNSPRETTQSSTTNVHKGFYYDRASNFYENQTTSEKPWYERDAYKEQEEFFKQQRRNSHIRFQSKQSWILYGCFLLVVTGYLMYYAAYSYATNYTLKRVDEKSRRISESYEARKQNAIEMGREARLEKLRKKWNQQE